MAWSYRWYDDDQTILICDVRDQLAHYCFVASIEQALDEINAYERERAQINRMNYSVASYGVSLANAQSRSKLRGIRP